MVAVHVAPEYELTVTRDVITTNTRPHVVKAVEVDTNFSVVELPVGTF